MSSSVSSNHTFAIIAYKDSPFLSDCIESLQQQTVKSEIVICTSTPSAYINRIAKKFSVDVKINNNPGKVNDWNFAYTQAKNKYVTLAHHDDIYYPQYTQILLELFNNQPQTLIAFADYIEIINFTNGKQIERKKSGFLNIKKLIIKTFFLSNKYLNQKLAKKYFLAFGCAICCPTVMFNKKMLKNFKFKPKFKVNIDWLAWYEMALIPGKFAYADEVLLQHRLHQASDTTTALADNSRLLEDLEMFEKFWPKWFAKILNFFYKLSYKNNEI